MHLIASLLLSTSVLTLTAAANVVPFRFKAKSPRSQAVNLSKRNTVSTELSNERIQYLVTLQVGTPPQEVLVRIATGSADLWMINPSNPYCSGASDSDIASQYRIDCNDDAFFNPADSSSWTDNSTEFHMLYEDRTAAWGSFGQDDVTINGARISKANFAVASSSNTTGEGVFGIGPRKLESVKTEYHSDRVLSNFYDNFPIQMKQQGLISSVSYSLYLDHIKEDTGTLLFGGIDHAKYKGNMGVVPVVKQRFGSDIVAGEPEHLAVVFNGLGVKDELGNSQWLAEFAVEAILDSGSAFSRLPPVLILPIARALNASYSFELGDHLPCQTAGSIMLDFSGVQVEVLVQAMLSPLTTTDGSPYTDDVGNHLCYLGINRYGRYVNPVRRYVLGDSILRGLYVVYDLENWEVGIATGDLDSESSEIEEITDRIPRGSSAPSYSSNTATSGYTTATSISVFLTNTGGKGNGPISPGTEGTTETRSSNAQSSNGAGRGESDEGGTIRSTANLWLAGILVLLS